MCLDHFNLLLTVISWYDAESTCSRLDPQKKYVCWGGLCLFEMQMMLHFEGLNCICHLCCQISSLLRSTWRLSQSESSTTTLYERVSLANSLIVEVRLFGRSLIYVRNNNRLSTDPCGTPAVTGHPHRWRFGLSWWEGIPSKTKGFHGYCNAPVSLVSVDEGLYQRLWKSLTQQHE